MNIEFALLSAAAITLLVLAGRDWWDARKSPDDFLDRRLGDKRSPDRDRSELRFVRLAFPVMIVVFVVYVALNFPGL